MEVMLWLKVISCLPSGMPAMRALLREMGMGPEGVIEHLPWLKERRLDILQHVSVTFQSGKRCQSDIVEDLPYCRIDIGWTQMEAQPVALFLSGRDEGIRRYIPEN
jgi:hypothetical protein